MGGHRMWGVGDGMLRGKNVLGTGLDGRRDGNSDKTGDGMVRGRRGELGMGLEVGERFIFVLFH